MERKLLNEKTEAINKLRARTEQNKKLYQKIATGIERVGAGKIESMVELGNLMIQNPVPQIRSRIVERAGALQTTNGIKINHQKMADLLDLPEDEIRALGQEISALFDLPSVGDAYLFVSNGIVKIDEEALEAHIDSQFRFYLDTPEKWEVYNDLTELAQQVDQTVEKFGYQYFLDAKIPLLTGGVFTGTDERNQPEVKVSPYRPKWESVAVLAKQIVEQ